MRIQHWVLWILLSLQVMVLSAQSNPLATVKIGEKKYNLHLVQSGETIYQISKKYNVGVSDILFSNPWGNDTVLLVGQVIKVPVKPLTPPAKPEIVPIVQPVKEEPTQSAPMVISPPVVLPSPSVPVTPTPPPVPSVQSSYVVVEKGMTLYGLSKQYNVSIAQLMGWNKMDSMKIRIGDTLFVKSPTQVKAEAASAQKQNIKVEPGRDTDKPQIEKPVAVAIQADINEKMAVSEENALLKEKFSEGKTGNKSLSTQRGSAGTILTSSTSMKTVNYCLHRTAPIGSILKVQSLVTNKVSYVKVLGKIPDTPENQPFMIRVSESAAKELGISTEKTFVEVSYYE